MFVLLINTSSHVNFLHIQKLSDKTTIYNNKKTHIQYKLMTLVQCWFRWVLYGDYLARVNFDPDEDGVVPDKLSLGEGLVGDEPREAEAECVGLLAGPLEVLPRRIRHKALNNVARL